MPPAGWYPDPGGSEHRRWWDGAAWHGLEPELAASAEPAPTVAAGPAVPEFPSRRSLREQHAAGPPAPEQVPGIPAPPVPDFTTAPRPFTTVVAPAPVFVPPARNPAATAGLVVGLISIVVPGLILAVAGLIASGRGLAQASRSARYGDGPVGRTRAGWGLGLSVVGTFTSLAALALVVSLLGYGPYPLAPQAQQKAAFVTGVHIAQQGSHLTADRSDADLLNIGWDTCETFRAGTLTRTQFAAKILDSKLSPNDYGLIIGLAESTMCSDAEANMRASLANLSNTGG